MVYVNFQLQWRNKEKQKEIELQHDLQMGTLCRLSVVGGGKVSRNERRMEDKMKIPMFEK